MSYIIAFSGKGGTGKTTLAGCTVRYLIEKTGKLVLGVDADSNSCLNEALGVPVHATIGGIRETSLEQIRQGMRQGGMSTEEIFDMQVQQSIIEARGFDLLVMGRPEGPGCYCAANNIIRRYTDKLSEDYSFVVIDNEAGMEHLSRRTAHKIDLLFIVSDPTLKGIRTAARINGLIDELSLSVARRCLIINRMKGDQSDAVRSEALQTGLPLAGIVAEDESVFNIDLAGKPVFDLPADSPMINNIYSILANSIEGS